MVERIRTVLPRLSDAADVPKPWRTPIAEWQRGLDKHDQRLASKLKLRHPILPMAEIKRRYPDQWVALLITHIDERGKHMAARVIDTAGHDDREVLEERVKASELATLEHPLCFYYTGVYDDFGTHR